MKMVTRVLPILACGVQIVAPINWILFILIQRQTLVVGEETKCNVISTGHRAYEEDFI